MGGEGAHTVETRMFCTVCLKSSCLLICFHSWSLDLSQTLIQTIQILKEEKTGPKPMEKIKKSPHVTCPASPQTLSMGRNFFFVFSGFCNCVSPSNISCSFFCVFCFPVSWAPGRNFHPDKHPLAQLSPLHILYWCLHWVTDFGYWAIRENYSKNNSITHLCRHSIGLMFYWYAEVLVPHL